MLKVRQSYRAHSARGLWQAVSLLTDRVSQADISTMELVQATKVLARVPQLDRGFDDFWISGRMEGVKTPMIPRFFSS